MKEYDFSNKKLYNGESHHEGMVVVPFVVENKKVAIEMNIKIMETFHTPDKTPYLVSFTEVPEEEYEKYMTLYNSEIREFLDDYGNVSYKEQFSRCTIDGKVCPLSNSCKHCKRKDESGRPLKETKKGMMSLDGMMESGKEPSDENDIEMDLLYEELLNTLGKINPYYPTIIQKLREGFTTSEIIKDLPVKKSKFYKDMKNVEAFVREFLK